MLWFPRSGRPAATRSATDFLRCEILRLLERLAIDFEINTIAVDGAPGASGSHHERWVRGVSICVHIAAYCYLG